MTDDVVRPLPPKQSKAKPSTVKTEERDAELSANAEGRRATLRKYMEDHGLKAHTWATRAGVSSGSLYAFLKGDTDSLSVPVINMLAQAEGIPPSVLMGEAALPDSEPTYSMGADGAITRDSEPKATAAYQAVTAKADHGWIKAGYTLFFRKANASACHGKLCVVETTKAMKLREVRRGYLKGKVNLLSLTGGVEEDVSLVSCHSIEWVRTV